MKRFSIAAIIIGFLVTASVYADVGVTLGAGALNPSISFDESVGADIVAADGSVTSANYGVHGFDSKSSMNTLRAGLQYDTDRFAVGAAVGRMDISYVTPKTSAASADINAASASLAQAQIDLAAEQAGANDATTVADLESAISNHASTIHNINSAHQRSETADHAYIYGDMKVGSAYGFKGTAGVGAYVPFDGDRVDTMPVARLGATYDAAAYSTTVTAELGDEVYGVSAHIKF